MAHNLPSLPLIDRPRAQVARRVPAAVRGAALLLASSLGLLAGPLAQAQSVKTYAHGIEMVNIPAGSFTMGSCPRQSEKDAFLGNAPSCSPQDPDATPDESPRHRVSVGAFELGKTEVTLGQFKAFIRAAGRSGLVDADFMKYNNRGDNAPVVQVNWGDAQDFTSWLNQTQGGGWRLPTEAEWEYACRAGGQHPFCGSNNIDEVAWHAGNSSSQRPVGGKRANAFGLHDMTGNVREWTQDCWNNSYQGAPSDGSAWTKGDCSSRVLRGGSWNHSADNSRAAVRIGFSVGHRFYLNGFRLARTR